MRYRSLGALAALLAVVAPSGASAQERQIGLRFGASLATIDRERTVEGADSYDVRTGITGGVFGILPVHDRIAFQVEALFTEKGGSIPVRDPNIVSGTITTRFKFHYMDIPALARVRGPRINAAVLHAFAGPTLSIRLNARQQTVFSGEGAFGFERDLAEEMKRFDLGLTIGAGAEIGPRMLVDARYTRGFSKVLEELGGAPLSNRGFLITAGVRIF